MNTEESTVDLEGEVLRDTRPLAVPSPMSGKGERLRRLAFPITLIYLISGVLWFLAGDQLLSLLVVHGGYLHGLKDVGFLAFSTAVLYFLLCSSGRKADPQAEALQRENERKLRQAATVFSSTREGIVITDLEGRVEAVNPAFCDITGYMETELLGANLSLLKSGKQSRAFYQTLWRDLKITGHWQGEIWNRRKDGEIYPEWLTISTVRNEQELPVNYVGVFLDISRIKHSEQQLEHLAHHDPLTDLPNRLLFLSRLEHALERALRSGNGGAVLFLDLDRFKHVNDSLGHPVGDELLCAVASRLRLCLRETDTLARLGGDEFLALLEDQEGPEGAAAVAEKLLERLADPFLLSGGNEVYIGASVGICLYPQDGESSTTLIQHADSALYQAKAGGRNTFRFYTEAQTRLAAERLALEAALRRGLEHGEFLVYYQPQVDLLEGCLVGVEALVRWRTPEGSLVAPGQFISLAEDTGLILPLGEWVLRQTCWQMRVWLDAGRPIQRVAVNLSSRQFRQPDLVGRIRTILAETGLPPCHLELELTESMLMDSDSQVEEKLKSLEQLGIRLAIDDFGTGYSSLAYLKRFPLHVLKVDQSFIRDIASDPVSPKLVTAILNLGRNLDLAIMAEGVETEFQRNFLLEHGCKTCQGFLFSRPIPAAELEVRWL